MAIQCRSVEFKISVFFKNNFCKADIIFVKTECIMVSPVVEVELRLSAFLSENNLCKIDVISAKPQCMMEKKYWISQKYLSQAAFVELNLSAFFSENYFCKIHIISVQA